MAKIEEPPFDQKPFVDVDLGIDGSVLHLSIFH